MAIKLHIGSSALVLILSLFFPMSVMANGNQPYPEFSAVYDASINGISMAEVSFSLRKLDNGDYEYRRKMVSVGVASLFGEKVSVATSRWRFADDWFQVLEYKSINKEGDPDKNLQLVFDWEAGKVENVSAVDPWKTDIPVGTLDKLVMQIALLFELSRGKTEFQYPVAHEGRVKIYYFKQVGEEKIKVPAGEFDTRVIERLKEDRDTTRLWSAPELNYFPVRLLKIKQNGLDREMLLREVIFLDQRAG